jgi:hypothetical protein
MREARGQLFLLREKKFRQTVVRMLVQLPTPP